ncbi:MAG: hypothetical protein JWM33_3445 [Caulobacteraceae bacterium]|nr:hypothetical protein [Caulobacteraceae bacterium]
MVAQRYLGVRDPIEAMEGLLPTWDYLQRLADTYGPGDARHRSPYQQVCSALNDLAMAVAGMPMQVDRGHEPGRENLPSIARLVAKERKRDADMAATREKERLAREAAPPTIILNPACDAT